MPEPLVTRNPEIQGGAPCLRGIRFPVRTLQAVIALGGLAHLRRHYSVLNDWSDEQLTEAAAYPRLPDDIIVGSYGAVIRHDDDGMFGFSDDAWFSPDDAPALIAAIQQAVDAIRAWRAACDEWEREKGATDDVD